MVRASSFLVVPAVLTILVPTLASATPQAASTVRLAQLNLFNAPQAAPRVIAPDVPFEATQMRKALELPRSETQFGFNAEYSPVTGTVWRWQFDPQPDPKAEVARLTGTLKNNDADAATWLQIGYFRNEAKDTAGSQEAYKRAEQGFRAQVAQRPQDAAPLQGLGVALSQLDQPAEAEKTLRAAVKLAPNDARMIAALAGYLISQSSYPLFNDLTRAATASQIATKIAPFNADGKVDDKALAEALAKVPGAAEELAKLADVTAALAKVKQWASPTRVQLTETRLQEAKTLSDLAVALAPRDPLVYRERAGVMVLRDTVVRGRLSHGRSMTSKPRR